MGRPFDEGRPISAVLVGWPAWRLHPRSDVLHFFSGGEIGVMVDGEAGWGGWGKRARQRLAGTHTVCRFAGRRLAVLVVVAGE